MAARTIFATLMCCALHATAARADELANSPARAGYEPTGRLLDFEARRHLDVDHGVDPMLTYVFETFAAPQLEDRVVAAGLLMLELDLALDKLIGPNWGAAYVSALAIHGNGLTDELEDIHGVSGNVAPPDVRLFEAWLEQPVGPLTLRAGILSADQEFLIADHSSTLLSATFGITSQFSANALGPVYPIGAPGASGRLELGKVTARLAVYDGTQSNERGIPNALGPDSLVMSELGARFLRVGGWRHSEHGPGIYAVVDEQVTEYMGTFARVGYSPDGPVRHYIDAGIRVTPGPERPDDLACIGIAFATSPDGPQTALEWTYELQIGWLTLQPDLQLLMLRNGTVAVLATRATIVF